MTTSTLLVQHSAPASVALRTGIALAAPGPFLGFMNSLFHGIDFTSLVRPGGFDGGGFLEALLVMSVWAFLAGTFFGWLRQRLDV